MRKEISAHLFLRKSDADFEKHYHVLVFFFFFGVDLKKRKLVLEKGRVIFVYQLLLEVKK